MRFVFQPHHTCKVVIKPTEGRTPVPTLGDMLHLDDNGRFTTSGNGTSLSSALDSSTAASRPLPIAGHAPTQDSRGHTPVRVTDMKGRLCGYYEAWQLADIGREFVLSGDVAKLTSRASLKARLALMRRSFDNPSLTPSQRERITSEINQILRSHPTWSRPEQPSQPDSPEPLPDLYVVRDPRGIYMGMYTLTSAQRCWTKCTLQDAVITTAQPLSFKSAARFSNQTMPLNIVKPKRALRSLRVAKQYNKTRANGTPSGYWKDRTHVTYRVLYDTDAPVCSVPYSCLSKGFGNKWVIIADDTVQIVGDWSPREVANGAELARAFASEQYDRIAAPGSVSAVKHTMGQQSRQPASSQPLKKRTAKQDSAQRIIRRVVRDENGCFMGVHALHEAKKVWADARLDSSLIVVPHTMSFTEASYAISSSPSFETPFKEQQYKSAIRNACLLPPELEGRDAAQFWAAMADTKLNVYNDMPIPIGRLTPKELNATFGTNWFLISLATAQVMSNLASGVIETRCKVAQQRAERSASEPSRPIIKAPTPSTTPTESKPTKKLNSRVFYVIKPDGKIAYQCQKKKSEPVKAYLERFLPSQSYIYTSSGFQLTQSLESLGFKKPQEFTKACAVACRGGLPVIKKPGALKQSKAAAATPPKVTVSKKDEQRPAPKGVAKTAPGKVSFDGPEHVLYVSKGTLSCERKGHSVESVTGSIVTLKGRLVDINVNYCSSCRRYFIGQREYEHYRDQYGPILGNFSFPASPQSGSGSAVLSKESPLMMCGYNVRESDGLSSDERQLILSNMIDRRILSKPRIIEYLQFFIGWREGNPSMRNACDKWREDLAFVRAYRMDTQRRFSIGAVRRYR